MSTEPAHDIDHDCIWRRAVAENPTRFGADERPWLLREKPLPYYGWLAFGVLVLSNVIEYIARAT